MIYRVYLSGYMTGYNFDSVGCWREEFESYIPREAPIVIVSPLRGERRFLGDFAEIPATMSADRDKTVLARDHWDTINSHVVVCNLKEAKRVSIGAVMEWAWAFDHNIPVIAIMDAEGCYHDHPMIRAARMFRVDTVEQAADQLLTLLALAP